MLLFHRCENNFTSCYFLKVSLQVMVMMYNLHVQSK